MYGISITIFLLPLLYFPFLYKRMVHRACLGLLLRTIVKLVCSLFLFYGCVSKDKFRVPKLLDVEKCLDEIWKEYARK